jgi:hypothetical protein
VTSEMLASEQVDVHASASWAWLLAAGSLSGQGGTTGGLGPIGASKCSATRSKVNGIKSGTSAK